VPEDFRHGRLHCLSKDLSDGAGESRRTLRNFAGRRPVDWHFNPEISRGLGSLLVIVVVGLVAGWIASLMVREGGMGLIGDLLAGPA
jgi:hypothetical protein